MELFRNAGTTSCTPSIELPQQIPPTSAHFPFATRCTEYCIFLPFGYADILNVSGKKDEFRHPFSPSRRRTLSTDKLNDLHRGTRAARRRRRRSEPFLLSAPFSTSIFSPRPCQCHPLAPWFGLPPAASRDPLATLRSRHPRARFSLVSRVSSSRVSALLVLGAPYLLTA